MKRPKRRVVRIEDAVQVCSRLNVKRRRHEDVEIKLWRLHLDCGHYVELAKRNWAKPPRTRRCSFCQSEGNSLKGRRA